MPPQVRAHLLLLMDCHTWCGLQDDEDLHEMCRMFRQNQSARLDAPPEILRQTFRKETYNITEPGAIAGDKTGCADAILASGLTPCLLTGETVNDLASNLGYIWDGKKDRG